MWAINDNSNVLIINGRRYDATTGELLGLAISRPLKCVLLMVYPPKEIKNCEDEKADH